MKVIPPVRVGHTHWATMDCRVLHVDEMKLSHMTNCIRMVCRQAESLMVAKATVLAAAFKTKQALKLLADSEDTAQQFKYAAKRYPIIRRMARRLEKAGVLWT